MISKNEIRARARAFAKEWEKETYEDGEAKSFWDDFFTVFGVSRRRVATFEYSVKKEDGRQGFVDVLWKGVMLAEHKSLGKDLDKAFVQAKEYFPGLKDAELPRYVVVSDFARMRVYDLESGNEVEFALADFHTHIDTFGFISGYEVRQYEAEEEASVRAAVLMAEFHNAIAKTGYAGHDLEVFLVRILFCLFADDTEIFPKSHFRTYVTNRTAEDGSDLGRTLLELFEVLNTPERNRQTTVDEQLAEFPYVNGAIFAERIASVHLDAAARATLLKCCAFDWSGISAAIFGSLFQGVMDEKERRQLGAHYTSEINILKVIQPLFLDELYNEFDAAKRSPKALDVFHTKLSSLTFLDPACGCGNFLVTTYRELRRLEIQVLLKKRKHDTNTLLAFGAGELSRLHVNQFYGIEIEEFPALVARTAMYLADHQMTRELQKEFGHEPARIPLQEPATIVHANALATDWASVVPPAQLSYIIGNPPFYGAMEMTPEQRVNLLDVFGSNFKSAGVLDFVSAWYKKSADYIHGTQIKVGLVSTNSIIQGEQVGILWRYLTDELGIVIHFAHQTFKWSNEARGKAAVHCVIIGFANFDTDKKYLYTYTNADGGADESEVSSINAYLVSGKNVFVSNRDVPLCPVPPMIFGNMPRDGGHLLMTDEEKNQLVTEEPDAEKFIRPFISAKEFLNNEKRWCVWLVDANPSELKNAPKILARIEGVRQMRLVSKAASTRKMAATPGIFGQVVQPKSSYVLIPRHSSERRSYIPMGFCSENDIVADSCMAVPNATYFHFGVLTSRMHMTWVRYTCGRLKSDYRYSKDIVYNNFPWPGCVAGELASVANQEKIAECAQAVLDARAQFSGSSLADLYDPRTMPPALVKAHAALDRAVDAAYNYRDTGSDTDRIAFLFGLYQEIVK